LFRDCSAAGRPTSFGRRRGHLGRRIEIIARPPGKSANISLLSGGEKTLTCVPCCSRSSAPAESLLRARRGRFGPRRGNTERFVGVCMNSLLDAFIIVTHSKRTMTSANTLHGVTMQESACRSASRCDSKTSAKTAKFFLATLRPAEAAPKSPEPVGSESHAEWGELFRQPAMAETVMEPSGQPISTN